MLYRKNKLGEELELPIFNHYYNISITALEFYLKNPGQSDTHHYFQTGQQPLYC